MKIKSKIKAGPYPRGCAWFPDNDHEDQDQAAGRRESPRLRLNTQLHGRITMKIKSKIKAGPLRACEWVAVKIKTKITAGPTIIIRGRSCA